MWNKILIFGLILFMGTIILGDFKFAYGDVTEITEIDPNTGKQTVIYKQGDLPGLIKGGQRTDFISFLRWFYPFLLSVAAVLAVVMIVIAGVQWAGSMGSEAAITSARDKLTNAILGLVLAFSAWLILNTINPDLVKLKLKGEIKAANQIALIR